jgi:predicted nucleic acid-binding protein
VAAFVSTQSAERLFTASICQAEILAGIAIMPNGHRRLDLEAAARAMFLEDFEGRVLPFDMEAAIAYAAIFAAHRRAGRSAATVDRNPWNK